MDDEDCSTNAADKDEDEALSVAKSLAGVRLADAPILLLVYFHKSLRAELAAIRRLAVEALNRCSHDLLTELHRRLEFLKLVYKYHCTTEDEVVFLTLDERVKNVSGSYSLEHECIDGLFDTVFDRLNVLLEGNENALNPFQELVFCIGTMQSFICQHMLKEEEQVYTSLMREFSSKEQASLVCQFLCSVPVMLLELFLPWMVSFLSKDEKVDVTQCMKEIVPEENSLQEVVISWLHCGSQPLAYANVGERVQQLNGSENTSILKSLTFQRSFEENQHQKQTYELQMNNDALRLWHRAIWKDLGAIRKNLYQIKSRINFPDLDSIVIQLKFLVDVLSFYSAALEKYYYPVLDELSSCCQSSLKEHFFTGSLQQLMNQHLQNGLPLCKFVEKLLQELESFLTDIRKQFATQESQVFTIFGKECSHQMQQQLLHVTLYMMPLGLLKCVITWFSSHLSEDESRFIIHGFDQRDSFVNKSFVFLLNEWFRMGYSGKTSVENFRMQLEKMFMSRCSFLSEQIKESVESSYLRPNMQDKGAIQQKMNLISTDSNYDCLPHSSSSNSYIAKNYEASYSSGILRHVYFPQKLTTLHPLPKISLEKSFTTYIKDEPVPVDLLFFFHKALKKDLEYLVFGSAQLAENASFLEDFYRHFHLMQLLFQIHSDAEDEIAFPALEARGKLQNISHSYTIDHKFEGEQFKKISCFLDEMLELQTSVSSTDAYIREQRYHQLSIRLHDVCRSVHQMLLEHVRCEETELWPLFRECFSVEEQGNIVKSMLGRIRADTLQHMIPWLMASLTPEEQHITMSLWRNATKNTNFDDWLAEWWEGYDIGKVVETSNISSLVSDPGEIISTYLPNDVLNEQKGESLCSKGIGFPQIKSDGSNMESLDGYDKGKDFDEEWNGNDCLECSNHFSGDKERWNEVAVVTSLVDKPGRSLEIQKNESTQATGAENLVAAIRRVSRDTSLDFHKKPHIIQNLLMSHWITREHNTHSQVLTSSKGNDISGQHPSYRDSLKPIFGCKHYKRNCKILAPCCNQLYACIRCHDEVLGQDHSVDRKSITQMMCMKCLKIQPIGSTCSTLACKNLSMARYYCSICKLFDDEREIYHCPYCNLCRVGKGLGIDYFHCMNCNACMSRSLSVHVCREKCFMDNCPICHEDIFTSSSPVKALRCGHLMHSTCFQDYTCTHYTCPLCSKSLGDMQVYFEMLDALLAEEKIPQEYSDQTQAILCNDCEKRGTAPFHWLYHKCSFCGSYNTRLL